MTRSRGQLVWTRHPGTGGFALVACVALSALLLLVAVGLLTLSAIQLRTSDEVTYAERARANARLALMLAVGQLQKQLGPDTRVSAKAEILDRDGNIKNPHWTGAWSTSLKDGKPVFFRDDASGGLRDQRTASYRDGDREGLGWLVSGTPDGPEDPLPDDAIELVGKGTLGAKSAGKPETLDHVVALPVTLDSSAPGDRGRLAWWTGDLGVKANIATPDLFEGKTPDLAKPGDGGWYRSMVSQEADTRLLPGAPDLRAEQKSRLASFETLREVLPDNVFSGDLFHDVTVHSEGVLANVARGRLKRDLTAFFLGTGTIDDWKNLPGLKDDDRMVGPANENDAAALGIDWAATRHRETAPRFGLLRRWANVGAPFDGTAVDAMVPKTEPVTDTSASKKLALANENPASIADFDTPDLFPVVVEGSYQWTMSWHRNVEPPANGRTPMPYQVRLHIYPRVVLWNPWNVAIRMEPCMAMIQGNGRFEMWTDSILPVGNNKITMINQWIGTEGGRNPNFNAASGVLDSAGYNDPYMGSYLFALPATVFQPGDCLVFSAARAAEYQRSTERHPEQYALELNELSCTVPPDPSRNYCVSNDEIGGGQPFYPITYWFAPTTYWSRNGRRGIENQGDDCRVVLKHLGNRTGVKFEDFDTLPQIAVVSASLQYGAGWEPRIAWNSNEKMPCDETDPLVPRPRQVPNVRTREGIRLRWHFETPSNILNSGPLAGTPYLEEALLANWNPRAAYATRTPWDNIGGSLPATGNLGGPWFFGAYTRDLYDQAVSWQDQMPFIGSDGRCHGNPFGVPQQGKRKIVLFDVPRTPTGVLSLGQFQQVKLSQFVWHPSYAVGQSLVDPRLSDITRTAPVYQDKSEVAAGGFTRTAIGWSTDSQRSADTDAWAAQGRAIFQDLPASENLVYDLSFEVNQVLWDDFFLSTGDAQAKSAFLEDRRQSPLPNGRMRLASGVGKPDSPDDLNNLHRAASRLTVDGAFNVNSTSVAAWKAVLGATRRLNEGDAPASFPRMLRPPGGAWRSSDQADDDDAWSGERRLTDAELDRLAREIVKQVKARGPFLSLADFVNRRLMDGANGRCGALQAAIDAANLNQTFDESYPLSNRSALPDYTHPDHVNDATRLDQTLKPASKAWGVPGCLTQGDILQTLGPMLSARSDTFLVRTFGEALDTGGRVRARAWCEAVVQRTPQPLDPDEAGINSRMAGKAADFGRRFIVKAFRWLRQEEI